MAYHTLWYNESYYAREQSYSALLLNDIEEGIVHRTVFIITLIFTVFVSHHALADNTDFFINLSVPKEVKPAPSSQRTFFIRTVTDTRSFAEPSSKPDIPSWGTGDPKERTEERKNKSVARASRRGGMLEGNVLIILGDVKTIMKDETARVLNGLGYSLIEKEEDIQPDTVPVDVEIKKFWGYFQEVFIGGTMSATIEAAITINLKDVRKTQTIQVESKMSARYPNKTANWEEVFTTALGYFNDAAMNELRQAIE